MLRRLSLAATLAAAASLVAGSSAAAQSVGEPLPVVALSDLSQSPAHGFEEFAGRVVLIEFFAYW